MSSQADTHILVGFADAVAAPEVAWSLVDAGFEVTVFTRRGTRPALRRSRQVRMVEITAPEQDAAAAVDDLVDAMRRTGATRLMPLDDFAMWTCARAAEQGAAVIGPIGANVEFALDKRLQLEAARAVGLDVPETRIVTTAAELREVDSFPVVIKSVSAGRVREGMLGRAGGYICANRDELAGAERNWAEAEPMLVQPLLRGVGEGLCGVAAGGEVVGPWSAHRRVRMMNPAGSGSSACRNVPVDPVLAERAAAMLRSLRWDGLFMVETLRDEAGTPWFMELNGRVWGSLALSRRLGQEHPALAAALSYGMAPPALAETNGHTVVCRHLGREIVHVAMVLRGPRSAAFADWPPRRRAVADVLRIRRSDRWYNLRRGDLGVFVGDTVDTVRVHALRFASRR